MLVRRLWFPVVTAALLACGVGCGKSASKSGPTTFTIKGASEVLSALDRKDYESTIRALAQVKSGVTGDQMLEYNQLLQKVKDGMIGAMSTNESAVKAYQALRFMEVGR